MDYIILILRGSVSQQPSIIESKTSSSGKFGVIPMKTSMSWKGKGGKEETKKTFHRVLVFGSRVSEVENLSVGDDIIVKGTLSSVKQKTKGGEEYWAPSVVVTESGDFVKVSNNATASMRDLAVKSEDWDDIPF